MSFGFFYHRLQLGFQFAKDLFLGKIRPTGQTDRNRFTQGLEFGGLLRFLVFQKTQTGTYNFADVVETPRIYLLTDKVFEVLAECNTGGLRCGCVPLASVAIQPAIEGG